MTNQAIDINSMNERAHQIIASIGKLLSDCQSGSVADAELIKLYIPLSTELDEIRKCQMSELERVFKEYGGVGKDLEEIRDTQWALEERVVALESIPMTENIAASFIHERGLTREFEAYMAEQVGRVSLEAGDKPAGLQ